MFSEDLNILDDFSILFKEPSWAALPTLITFKALVEEANLRCCAHKFPEEVDRAGEEGDPMEGVRVRSDHGEAAS